MRLALATLALAAGVTGASAQQAAQPLSFAVDSETYTVPDGGLLSADVIEKEGLTFCLAPEVEQQIATFTDKHKGETVAISIGDTTVFHVKIVKPFASGCINWPLHPVVANNYRNMLLGEQTSQ